MRVATVKTIGVAGLALYTVGTAFFTRALVKNICDTSFDEFSTEFEKNEKIKKISTGITWAGDILMFAAIAAAKKGEYINKFNIIDVLKLKH